MKTYETVLFLHIWAVSHSWVKGKVSLYLEEIIIILIR